MIEDGSNICQELLDDVDKVFPPVDAASAKLNSDQAEELNQMRQDIRRLCESGEEDAARRVAQLAIALIQGGPPDTE